MKRLSYLLAIIAINLSCNTKSNDINSRILPKGESRIIEFERIAIMDTVTAIINGQLVFIDNTENLKDGSIHLTNGMKIYKATSDSIGEFGFFHIAAGTYKLSASHVGYKELFEDSLHIGTGDIINLKIGLGADE